MTQRERYDMLDWVMDALNASKLRKAYDERPPYQRNDYIGWITRARRPDTQNKRLDQMIDELKQGDVYMKMAWNPKAT